MFYCSLDVGKAWGKFLFLALGSYLEGGFECFSFPFLYVGWGGVVVWSPPLFVLLLWFSLLLVSAVERVFDSVNCADQLGD